MSEIARIVEQLKQVHEGEAWHGPSVGESLEGLDATGAARRPIEGGHSIWEGVHHGRVTGEGGRALGESLEGVDAAGPARRPIEAAHSIWEIVHHVRVTGEVVRADLTGE